jgi:hypothetical protein
MLAVLSADSQKHLQLRKPRQTALRSCDSSRTNASSSSDSSSSSSSIGSSIGSSTSSSSSNRNSAKHTVLINSRARVAVYSCTQSVDMWQLPLMHTNTTKCC